MHFHGKCGAVFCNVKEKLNKGYNRNKHVFVKMSFFCGKILV